MIIMTILLALFAALLLWFGWQLETGRRRPNPHDKFFPLFGRNVDYVLGAAGLLAGLGMVCMLVGLWWMQAIMVGSGAVLVVVGLVRAYLSPKVFGPDWARKAHSHHSHQ